MKARDIIPDWPRGTSTSKPYESDMPLIVSWFRHWSPSDVAMLEDEADSDRRYHEAQDCMMEDWHRSRSQGTSVLTQMLFAGELSRPDFPAEKRWGAESPFVEMVRAKSAERLRQIVESVYAGRPYYELLEDHIWPTYGGITRQTFTTPGINSIPNWTPSEAGNITLAKLQEAFDKVKHLQPNKMYPPYYRTHPATYQNMTTTLCNKPEKPDWLPDWINFSGIKIVPDPKVPLGEFWPPEGWKADA